MKNRICKSLYLLIIWNIATCAIGGAFVPNQPRFLQIQNAIGDTITIIEDQDFNGIGSEALEEHISDLEISALQTTDAMLTTPQESENATPTLLDDNFLHTIAESLPQFITIKAFSVKEARNYIIQKRNAVLEGKDQSEFAKSLDFSTQLNKSKRKAYGRDHGSIVQSYYFISPRGFDKLIENLQFPMFQETLITNTETDEIEKLDYLLEIGLQEANQNRVKFLEDSLVAPQITASFSENIFSKINRLFTRKW